MKWPLLLSTIGIFCFFSNFSCSKVNLPDTQLGNWVQAAPIGNSPRGYCASFVIGDRAYVGLGYNESAPRPGRLKDFWTFSVDSGWTQLEDFPGAPRSNAAAFTIGNYGYVGVGWDEANIYQDFYQYDPAGHRWTKKADYHDPRYDAVGFSVQGKGYIGTGFNVYAKNDFYRYDPDQDSWTLVPGTSGNFSKRTRAVAFVYKDKAYIVTGSSNGVMTRDMWSFDPSQSSAWHQLPNITNTDSRTFDDGYTDIQREYATAFVNGDQAYLTTGSNVSMQTSTWAYDFASEQWTRRTSYPKSPRNGAVSFTIKGFSFLGTGFSGSNATYDDFDQFQPKVAFNPNDY
ncbi:MAG: hypothetical protein JST68_29085 [Bacteroidetes bacterium]|nr:hypothetical protein [Bacteroidota bacterium]